MMLMLAFVFSMAFAEEPLHWSHALKVVDRHEFYKNNENIVKPQDGWQLLFSILYLDRNINLLKDCVFFKVPGQELGILKIKAIASDISCDQFILAPGDKEVKNIKTLHFFTEEKKVLINYSLSDFSAKRWEALLQTTNSKAAPVLGQSSADFISSPVLYLSNESQLSNASSYPFLKDGTLCHNVNDSCQIISPSICHQCREGWYEIPNGCKVGPKYCGYLRCGQKNGPACRRGMKWQNPSNENFDCRIDSSYAYCSSGLTIQCEGNKAYCR